MAEGEGQRIKWKIKCGSMELSSKGSNSKNTTNTERSAEEKIRWQQSSEWQYRKRSGME
jgi:hypothetical protein